MGKLRWKIGPDGASAENRDFIYLATKAGQLFVTVKSNKEVWQYPFKDQKTAMKKAQYLDGVH